eukprot:365366-Chlamydomonas_euryale.AAC.6
MVPNRARTKRRAAVQRARCTAGVPIDGLDSRTGEAARSSASHALVVINLEVSVEVWHRLGTSCSCANKLQLHMVLQPGACVNIPAYVCLCKPKHDPPLVPCCRMLRFAASCACPNEL